MASKNSQLNQSMNTRIKNLFLLPALIAGSCLSSPGLATAQTFTTLKSFGFLTNVTGFYPRSTLVRGPDGTLYGTATSGEGSAFGGTVFKMQPDGSGFTTLKLFTNYLEGFSPNTGVTLSGTVLYGTTYNGGSSGQGTVFSLNTDGTGFTVLKNFSGSDGANPNLAALTVSGSVLYGTTYSGGASGNGTVFALNTDGTGFTVLKNFAGTDGANPNAALTLSGGVLYGTTEHGGSSGYDGTVFALNTDGTGYTVLWNFTNGPDGAFPDCVLTLSGSALYGTTYGGGSNYSGTVFTLNTDGTGYAILKHLAQNDGVYPGGPLALSGSTLYGTTTSGGGSNGFGAVFQVNTDGTGYAVLKTFTNSPDGSLPYAGVLLTGSVLYGTTVRGGDAGFGAVFKLNTDGTGYAVIKSFGGNGDGRIPYADLTMADGVLYGSTPNGGILGQGTVFRVNTNGTGYTVLKKFTGGSDGAYPSGNMVLSGGVLYGTTSYGGSSSNGVLFKLNTDGSGYTVLMSFTGDASYPYGLTLSGNVLYGTTVYGGSAGLGSVYQVNTDGTGYTVLKRFVSEGRYPFVGMTLSGGVLYGTTEYGGASRYGTVFKVNPDGTGFTALKSFSGIGGDGSAPDAVPVLSGNVVFGTTAFGGISNAGTIFRVNTDGTGFTTLKHFTDSPDGAFPHAGLTLAGNTLYGTTTAGGSGGYGTLFKVSTNGIGFTILKAYDGSDGSAPRAALTLSGSLLYGTTSDGTVFRVSTSGTGYTVLHYFAGSPDGQWPWSGLALSGSWLYGTTSSGGTSNYGTVFKITTSGLGYTVLKSFDGYNEGGGPYGGVVVSGNALYGTTWGPFGGTLFRLNTDGTAFAVMHSFTGGGFDPTGDGGAPYAGLALSGSTLYGVTSGGGTAGWGTIFRVNTDGTGYSVLKSFATDGAYPSGVAVSGGVLYGATEFGGPGANGSVFALNADGSGFTNLYAFTATPAFPNNTNHDGADLIGRLTLSGNTLYGTASRGGTSGRGTVFALNTDGTGFTTLHNFSAEVYNGQGSDTNIDGAAPQAGVAVSGSTLYGTAVIGGSLGEGTVFSLNTDGTGFTTLHNFTGGTGGSEPYAAVILSGNTLYGTTEYGGSLDEGTVFSLSLWPQLAITPSAISPGGMILTWPATLDYAGYTLQSTASLIPPVVWVTNSAAPVVLNGQLTVTNPITGAQQFYRLVR
jgi:uncharacterized repeat protein (TIGR03803 family)